MTVPARSGRPGGSGTGPGGIAGLPPLLLVFGAVALAAILTCGLGVVALLFRGVGSGPQEVVGSALPPSWQPGDERGVGQLPPPPRSATVARPSGAVPPLPEARPYPTPTPGAPPEEGEPQLGDTAPPEETSSPLGDDPVTASFEPPRLVYLPTPEYPRAARRAGREGTVQLQIRVGADGEVRSAEVVGERLGLGLEQAARRAAFGARFEPARANGMPIEAETRIAIRFRLQ